MANARRDTIGRWAASGVLIAAAIGSSAAGQPPAPSAQIEAPPVYKPAYDYPIFEEMRAAREAAQALRDSLKRLVDDRYEQERKAREKEPRTLRLDWSAIDRPADPAEFRSAYHHPPVAQFNTGTCWAFCATSFFESEVFRLTGRAVKLSEMWAVYWEYVEKARRYVREFGHSSLGQGSQDQGVQEVYRLYGAVPHDAYPGTGAGGERHDHTPLMQELRRYLDWVAEHGYWNEEQVLGHVRAILDAHLGRPPESVDHEGRRYAPPDYLREVLRLDPAAYVSVVSTLVEPFGHYVLFDVEDNWRRSEQFLNLPLDAFYSVIRSSLEAGYTVSIGGDTSEPGLDGKEDAAVVPPWDIPGALIDQASRELRIYNGTTGDDHGFHLVGWKRHGGRDWFLGKDSNSGSRLGRFAGYMFYDGDYIRLKMLSFMVHRDRLTGLLPE